MIRRAGVADVGLAAAVALTCLVEIVTYDHVFAQSPYDVALGWHVLAVTATFLLVLVRRRVPLVSALLLTVVAGLLPARFPPTWPPAAGWCTLLVGQVPALVGLVGVYTVFACGSRWRSVAVAWWLLSLVPWLAAPQNAGVIPAALTAGVALLSLAIAAGRASRAVQERQARLHEATALLAASRQDATQDAADAEREQWAREVQHSVTDAVRGMTALAHDAAAALADGSTEAGRDLTAALQDRGHEALARSRAALALLRDDAHPARRASELARVVDVTDTPRAPHLLDLAILLGLGWFAFVEMVAAAASANPDLPWSRLPGYALSDVLGDPADLGGRVLLLLPVLTVRRWPLPSALVTALGVTWIGAQGHLFGLCVPLVLLLALGRTWAHGTRRGGLLVACLAGAALVPALPSLRDAFLISPGVVYGLLLPGACLVGYRRHRLLATVEELAARRQSLAQLRAAETERARRSERLRLARELHDLTAHSLAVMTVQATAAARVLDQQPEQALSSLSLVAQVGEGVLDECAALFAPDAVPLGEPDPVAGLGDLPALADRARAAGVDLHLDVQVDVPLPPTHAAALYRAAQEALTNVIKHAAPTPATLRLRTARGEATLVVTNPLPSGPRAVSPSGQHGIIGLRERVRELGGTAHAGVADDGAFTLSVAVPLTSGAHA